MPRELAVIVPAYRERANLSPLVERLTRVLEGIDWEVVFVDDDSDDGSREELLRLAGENPRVRFLLRIGRRGLASACVEGMCATPAEFLAVMDADLQHDEALLPEMVCALRNDPRLDLVVGTRYAGEGDAPGLSPVRKRLSTLATNLSKLLTATSLSDPMSGFFALRREVFEKAAHRITGEGFKILLDLLLSSPQRLKVHEIPYTFRERKEGRSKLDILVSLEFLFLLADKLLGHLIPLRFAIYIMVGLSGVVLHLVVLAFLLHVAGWEFFYAQLGGTLAAMTSNFLINNSITFRTRRLRGKSLLPGALLYIAVCSVGAVVNLVVAGYLFESGIPWWVAGAAGAGIGAVWNYAVSRQIVWTWFHKLLLSGKRLGQPVTE